MQIRVTRFFYRGQGGSTECQDSSAESGEWSRVVHTGLKSTQSWTRVKRVVMGIVNYWLSMTLIWQSRIVNRKSHRESQEPKCIVSLPSYKSPVLPSILVLYKLSRAFPDISPYDNSTSSFPAGTLCYIYIVSWGELGETISIVTRNWPIVM